MRILAFDTIRGLHETLAVQSTRAMDGRDCARAGGAVTYSRWTITMPSHPGVNPGYNWSAFDLSILRAEWSLDRAQTGRGRESLNRSKDFHETTAEEVRWASKTH